VSDIRAFLAHTVEGYLFGDLRALQSAPRPGGAPDGGLGYPLVLSAFAGIELLGGLLSPREFDRTAGLEYFRGYWTTYLYPPPTSNNRVADAIYALVRHGLAHGFDPKGRTGVVWRQPALHLKRTDAGLVCIDAVQLSNDLMESYRTHITRLLVTTAGEINEGSMTERLREMRVVFDSQAAQFPLASMFQIGTDAKSAAISHATR
jgi:hypothetical protein